MLNVHLVPIVYVGFFIFVRIILAKYLKVDLVKSESFRIQEIDDAKKELDFLMKQQQGVSMQDEFAKYSKLQRQIVMKQKSIEILVNKYTNLNIQKKDDNIENLKKIINTFLENSFLVSIIFYVILKNIKIPLNIDSNMFYPLQGVLGFTQENSKTIFQVSFLFSYLNVRFCNKIASYFINQLLKY